jgi:chromosome segregation ATPase
MAKDYIASETADLRTKLTQAEQERDEYRRLWGILAEQNPRLIAKVNAAEQRVRALEGAERLIACQKDGILTLKERLAQAEQELRAVKSQRALDYCQYHNEVVQAEQDARWAKERMRALEAWRAAVWKTPSPRDNSVLRRLDIQCNITVTEE